MRRPDLLLFLQSVLKDIRTGGARLELAAIHIAWMLHIQFSWRHGLDAFIWAPMGHGKSTLVAVGLPLYLLGVNPNNRVKILSATDPLARDRVSLNRTYIEGDADYRAAFPHVQPAHRDMWSGGKFYVQRQGMSPDASLEAHGILGTGVGGRCDYLIIDDIADRKNSQSKVTRTAVIDALSLTWKTRLEPWGRLAGIGTPYHEEDVNYWLRSRPTTCTLMCGINERKTGIDFQVRNSPSAEHPLHALASPGRHVWD